MNYIISIIFNIFILIKHNINCLTVINYIKSTEPSIFMSLIGFEVSLITIFFIFLPFIIQDKKYDVYLGHKISTWILYDRKKNKLLSRFVNKHCSNISIAFIFGIVLIGISVILCIISSHLIIKIIIIAIFFIFLHFITTQVKDYLEITSNDNIILSEIEEEVKKLINQDENKFHELIANNQTTNVTYNRKTLQFLIKHYNQNKIPLIFTTFKSNFIQQSKNNIYIVYNEILSTMESIDKNNYIYINWYEVYTLMKNTGVEYGEGELENLISRIIDYNIKGTICNEKNYSNMIRATYDGIRENDLIGEETKEKILCEIFEMACDRLIRNDNTTTQQIREYYIFDYFKDLIDSNDVLGLEMLKNYLEEEFHEDEDNKFLFTTITLKLITYFYYLLEIEESPYIKEEAKDFLSAYYKTIDDTMKKLCRESEYYCSRHLDQVLSESFKNIHLWEKYENKKGITMQIKLSKVPRTIQIAKMALLIIYKSDENINNNINQIDVDTFQSEIKNNKLAKNTRYQIIKFSKYINTTITKKIIDNYINNLYKNVESLFKSEYININNDNKIKELQQKINKQRQKIKQDILKNEIFNSENPSLSIKKSIPIIIEIDTLDYCIENNIVEKLGLYQRIENYIKNYINEKFIKTQENNNIIIYNYGHVIKDIDLKIVRLTRKEIEKSVNNKEENHNCILYKGFNIKLATDEIKKYYHNMYVKLEINITFEIEEKKVDSD